MVSLLPKIMQDTSNLTIESCIASAFDIDINPFLIYLIDHVDVRLLKYLAYQFHILGDEGWNLAETEDEKRDLLKIAIQLHRLKGTKAAVERCLSLLGFDGEIEEWFEYTGRRKRFRIVLTLTNKLQTEELYNLLIRCINAFKNKTAILESLDIRVYPKGYVYTFGRVVVDEVITISGVREEG